MMWRFYTSLLSLVTIEMLLPIVSSSPNFHSSFTGPEPCGEPLILTPLLEMGKVMEARSLSLVKPAVGGAESYSGFFTVNKTCQSNLFFWFFPAKKGWQEAPVVQWLQGGPGASSLFGLFTEVGPFSFDQSLKPREFSWNVENNLLFIDQPVGTGFSFTRQDCYSDETRGSEELHSALVQFFHLFPEIKENEFVLAGESYAGHYIPEIAYEIHHSNQHADFKINLKGMMIGNGWMDPSVQGNTTEYLYQIGLSYSIPNEKNQNILRHHLHKKHHNLIDLCVPYDAYNYLKFAKFAEDPYVSYLQMQTVRKSIHVGNQTYNPFNPNAHIDDEGVDITAMVVELLENYPIVFYNGQVDTVCPYPLLVKFVRALNWSGAEDYKRASRQQWCEDGVLAGYHKSAHNLHEVMVRAAGHMVPTDQPLWAFRLVNSVTNNPPDKPLASLTPC